MKPRWRISGASPSRRLAPGGRWSHDRSRGKVRASAPGANSSSAAMEPSPRVAASRGAACHQWQTTGVFGTAVRAAMPKFGTAVRECGKHTNRLRKWRTISWRAQIQREEKAATGLGGLSVTASADEPPKTRLEWDWAICIQGWAVWFRGLVLRGLEGAQFHRAVMAHHGARIPRKLLVVFAIASVIGHHVIGAALAHVP